MLSAGDRDNVFADIGVPDAPEYLIKADLARKIVEIIRRKNLSQTAAARQLGIDQPKVSALMRGLLTGFSTERLVRFVTSLGAGCEIVINGPTTLAETISDATDGDSTRYIFLLGVSDIRHANSFACSANEDWRLAAPLVLTKDTFPKHALEIAWTR